MQLWMGILSRLYFDGNVVASSSVRRGGGAKQLFGSLFLLLPGKFWRTFQGKVKALCWPWKADCLLWSQTRHRCEPSRRSHYSRAAAFAKAMSAPFHSRIAENASPTHSPPPFPFGFGPGRSLSDFSLQRDTIVCICKKRQIQKKLVENFVNSLLNHARKVVSKLLIRKIWNVLKIEVKSALLSRIFCLLCWDFLLNYSAIKCRCMYSQNFTIAKEYWCLDQVNLSI